MESPPTRFRHRNLGSYSKNASFSRKSQAKPWRNHGFRTIFDDFRGVLTLKTAENLSEKPWPGAARLHFAGHHKRLGRWRGEPAVQGLTDKGVAPKGAQVLAKTAVFGRNSTVLTTTTADFMPRSHTSRYVTPFWSVESAVKHRRSTSRLRPPISEYLKVICKWRRSILLDHWHITLRALGLLHRHQLFIEGAPLIRRAMRSPPMTSPPEGGRSWWLAVALCP